MLEAVIGSMLILGVALGLLTMHWYRGHPGIRRCYRCALPSEAQFMNLDYCPICRQVVMAMYPMVSHDPPFGFPGAKGYDPIGPDPYERAER